ncbi:hypothetical protein DOTSEDRAFT_74586 [Dothistroma septosporum NZE10]|uniref:Uncharacterized protein n=1 Tax=Dothistroma septosporum (strain NZE10 / CBS 128990) TaxID=675120 RepID=N1PIH3_DOTSN|nr:hypothetical protein DOTSEDRAFT_74586 [Dothistroma septosporum NZE10]
MRYSGRHQEIARVDHDLNTAAAGFERRSRQQEHLVTPPRVGHTNMAHDPRTRQASRDRYWHLEKLQDWFRKIHKWSRDCERESRSYDLLGANDPDTVLRFSPIVIRHCYIAIVGQVPPRITEPIIPCSQAGHLRRMLLHTLHVDYGYAATRVNTSSDRAIFLEPGRRGQWCSSDLRDDIQWSGLPSLGVRSAAHLYSRFRDPSGEYRGSIEAFWVPQGPDVLAFKLCYDWHLIDRLSLISAQMKYDQVTLNELEAMVLRAAIIRVTYQYLPECHLWRLTMLRWEARHSDTRRERQRQEQRVSVGEWPGEFLTRSWFREALLSCLTFLVAPE